MNPNEWIIKGEVGTSSKTIWAVMMGVEKRPRQCDNFRRVSPYATCYNIYNLLYNGSRLCGRVFIKWVNSASITNLFLSYLVCYWLYPLSIWQPIFGKLATYSLEICLHVRWMFSCLNSLIIGIRPCMEWC